MKKVQRLIISLIAATTAQAACAMQPAQQLDLSAMKLAIFCNQNIAPEYRDACMTKVNAMTNQQQLESVREFFKYAEIKTILKMPLSEEREKKLLHRLLLAIASEDLPIVQFIAANVDTAEFIHLIHNRCLLYVNQDGKMMPLPTAYHIAQEASWKIATFFDKYFPPVK